MTNQNITVKMRLLRYQRDNITINLQDLVKISMYFQFIYLKKNLIIFIVPGILLLISAGKLKILKIS